MVVDLSGAECAEAFGTVREHDTPAGGRRLPAIVAAGSTSTSK
jgi:hypothetical protein